MLTTTINNFEPDQDFQVDELNRIIYTKSLSHIKNNIYTYAYGSIVFFDGVTPMNTMIVERVLCDIRTLFTSEPIEFYITRYGITYPIGIPVIVQAGSALKINDSFSLVSDEMIILYYENDRPVPGNSFELIPFESDIFGNPYNSGIDREGNRMHFSESQYKIRLNGDDYWMVKKKDILICE